MDSEWCRSDFIDATVDCDLPAGHDGPHRGTIEWDQSDPPPPVDPEKFRQTGYFHYLAARFGWPPS